MATGTPTRTVILYLGSEPAALAPTAGLLGEPQHSSPTVGEALVTIFNFSDGLYWQQRRGEVPARPGGEPRRFRADASNSLRITVEVAQELGWVVRARDVNSPGGPAATSAKPPTSSETLPVLVRPDGARLAGVENFTRAKVRRFLSGGSA